MLIRFGKWIYPDSSHTGLWLLPPSLQHVTFSRLRPCFIALCISRNQTAPNLHGHFLRCFLNRQFQYPSVYYIYDTQKWAVWTDSSVLSQNPKFLMILHEDYYILKTFSYRLTVTKGWKNTRSNIPQLLAWHREIPQPTTGKTPAWVPCPHSTGKPKTFWDFRWRRGNYG